MFPPSLNRTRFQDCVWVFTTTPGHRIKLVFTEFEMEPHQVRIRTFFLYGSLRI